MESNPVSSLIFSLKKLMSCSLKEKSTMCNMLVNKISKHRSIFESKPSKYVEWSEGSFAQSRSMIHSFNHQNFDGFVQDRWNSSPLLTNQNVINCSVDKEINFTLNFHKIGGFASKRDILPTNQNVLTSIYFASYISQVLPHKINSLPLGDLKQIYICNFQADFNDKWQMYVLSNCWQINGTRPYWWNINIGSGNGLVPPGNKPLFEAMMTQIHVAIWRH